MTIGQLNKIMKVVMNSGVVIANKYSEFCPDTHEISEFTDILTLINYGSKGYHFYIKENGEPLCELEEIL